VVVAIAVAVAVCPLHSAVRHRWSGLPCCCWPYFEQCARHVTLSRPHPCLFSEVTLRLSSSGVPSYDLYWTFIVLVQWQLSFLDT